MRSFPQQRKSKLLPRGDGDDLRSNPFQEDGNDGNVTTNAAKGGIAASTTNGDVVANGNVVLLNVQDFGLQFQALLQCSLVAEKLSSITTGTSFVSEYLRFIKNITDELSLIGYPLDDIDLVLYYLSALGLNFKEIATVLHS
ncbi:hypothetical protein L6164_026112 [Bauhinia variegata]|uniref:Uncharacterized protein n=1 Tax=Bauhinia variegata TaxID=167791 RepID=A0ACB9LP77_BAUVA|nr:hypothetical protein L6164_026112 [Bauhinia variegata]